jgi:hypothetical protein
MPDDDDNSGGSGGDSETVTMTRAEFNSRMAAARRTTNNSTRSAPAASPDNIADIVSRTVAATLQAMQPQQTAQPQQQQPQVQTAAPASSAGSRVDPITSGAIVDIWKLSPAQLDQLGPSGVRREYERHLAEGARRSGAPRVPQHPRAKGGK